MFSRRWSKKLRLDDRRLRIESLESRIVMSAGAIASAPLDAAPVVQTSAALLSTEEWVHSLTYTQFHLLAPNEVQYLTLAQVATIPNTNYFGLISAASRAAFSVDQVRALNMSNIQVNLLTAQQIGYLTTPQIQSLPFWELEFLHASQIPSVSTAQIASINSVAVFSSWSAASRAALTVPQVQAINTSVVRPTTLSATQMEWLTPTQVQMIASYDLNLLPVSQIPHVSTAQIASIPSIGFLAGWTPAARAALNATQVRHIQPAAMSLALLTAPQIGYLSVPQIQSVPFWEFSYLTPTQIPYLTVTQMASINSAAVINSWSAAAKAALTVPQVQAINISLVRPIALSATQIAWLTPAQVQAIANYDLNLLPASQIRFVTTAQIASIPNSGFFASWTANARSAMTPPQIQAIAPAALSVSLLTSYQISVLLQAQVQAVPAYETHLLSAPQIPWLTSAQVAAVTSLTPWSVEARAALTLPQVQSLNVALVRIEHLTPTQRVWMTAAQVRSVPYYDLHHLPVVQVPNISAAQIASIPTIGMLGSWTSAARAAMTSIQVMSLSTSALSLTLLTPQQVGYLLPPQIQQVPVYEFAYLGPNQVRYLTTAQIGSISSRGLFEPWSAASRAALTYFQVQALDAAKAGVTLLTPTQMGWLSYNQLQNVANFEWSSLLPWQIPQLSPTLFSSISAAGTLAALSDSSQVMLTRAQLLNLPENVWADYSLTIRGPSGYHPALHTPIGPDGIPQSQHLTEEADRFFALVPVSSGTHFAAANGDWTSPSTWSNGIVPGAGARVVIGGGLTVRFNAFMNTALDWLRVDGALEFAVNQNTQLKVDTVVVTSTGKLHIGTALNPIQNNVTARVLIADGGPINVTRDPYQLGRGVVSRGEVRMYGQVVTPYVSLAVNPAQGDSTLYLASVPTNWKVGDRLVVTGTVPTRDDFGADEVQILGINGSVVTISPLSFAHVPPPGYNLSVQVANLNRNIVFEAEDPTVVQERPHMVFIHNTNVEIENIRVHGFGRTDKSVRVNDTVVVNGVLQPGTGTNQRARYAIHFHHTGVNPQQDPASVRGSVVEGSPGWGYVNHSSNVDFTNNVAYGVRGSAFVTEDGNEIGSFRGNLAVSTFGVFDNIGSRTSIHDFGFRGHGFWFQGPGVSVVDNINAGSLGAGFLYFTTSSKNKFDAVNLSNPELAAGHEVVPVDFVPLKQFQGNTAYAGSTGLEIWHHMSRINDGQTYIDDFTSWNNHIAGIEMQYSGQITVRNSTLIGSLTNPTGTGVGANRFTDDLTFENLHAVGFQVGIATPVRGATIVDGGYFAAVQAILVEKGYDSRRTVDIMGPVTFATLSPAQLAGRLQYSVYMSMNVNYAEQAAANLASFFAPDLVYFRPEGGPAYQLYFFHQMRGVAPFTAAASGSVPAAYIGLKNWQLQLYYGKVFAGEMVANYDSFERPGFYGLLRNLV